MKSIHESVGKVFDSANYGRFVVEEYINSSNVTVRFLETGGVKKTKYCHVLSGGVRDDMFPSVCGVGYIGNGNYKSRIGRVKTTCYHKWRSMINRCYSDEYHKLKPTYKDCTVCEEWHNFQNFAKWFEDNYPQDGKDYQLDKDIKVRGNRVYSPDTCMFVSASDNTVAAHAKSWKIRSPDGVVHDIYNMSEFCRENGLSSGNVSAMLSGKYNSSKGWTRAD